MYSQILCYVLERWIRTQYQILFGNDSWNGAKIHHNTEHWTQSTENRWNSSGIFPQDSLNCSSSQKSKSSWAKLGESEQFQGRIIFMLMFNDIMWWNKDKETECVANATFVSVFAKRFPAGRWSFLGPRSETKWYSTDKDQEENGIESLNWWWSNSENADTQFSEQRVRCLEERSKAKEVENYLYTFVPMVIRLKLFFAQSFLSISSVSAEQSQNCVKSTVSAKLAQGDLLWQSSLTHFSRQQTCWWWHPHPRLRFLHKKTLLQKHKELVEKLSQPDQLIQVCTDAGFLKTVEVGQYFMTKHTDEFLQFAEPVTCREYTLPRDDKSTDPKGWM